MKNFKNLHLLFIILFILLVYSIISIHLRFETVFMPVRSYLMELAEGVGTLFGAFIFGFILALIINRKSDAICTNKVLRFTLFVYIPLILINLMDKIE